MKIKRLKITEHGTSYNAASRVPMIRTRGHWLRKAGFVPNSYIQLTILGPGVIELRSVYASNEPTSAPKESPNENNAN